MGSSTTRTAESASTARSGGGWVEKTTRTDGSTGKRAGRVGVVNTSRWTVQHVHVRGSSTPVLLYTRRCCSTLVWGQLCLPLRKTTDRGIQQYIATPRRICVYNRSQTKPNIRASNPYVRLGQIDVHPNKLIAQDITFDTSNVSSSVQESQTWHTAQFHAFKFFSSSFSGTSCRTAGGNSKQEATKVSRSTC